MLYRDPMARELLIEPTLTRTNLLARTKRAYNAVRAVIGRVAVKIERPVTSYWHHPAEASRDSTRIEHALVISPTDEGTE